MGKQTNFNRGKCLGFHDLLFSIKVDLATDRIEQGLRRTKVEINVPKVSIDILFTSRSIVVVNELIKREKGAIRWEV